jgi:hypothetical protein
VTSPQKILSPLWTGNFTLDNFNAALSTPNVVSNKVLPDQKFWASPWRPADDPLSDVMEVSLATPRLINFVSLSLSNYPLTLTIQYYDADSLTWHDVQNADGSGSAVATILDSNPAVIPAASTIPLHYHPQHSFSGHWKSVQLTVKPIMVQSLRFILKRNPHGRVPVNAFGTKVDYSVAAKDVVMGYQVASLDDIPNTDPLTSSFSEYEPFATTTDALGSTSKYSMRIDRASNALANQSGSSTDMALVWKSDPQPIPWAVVNFYMDLRDVAGTAQVIDRFFVDPLYEGPNLNLYWSNDEPSSSFAPLRDPLMASQVLVYDQRGISGSNVLHAGAANLGYAGYVEINNTAVDFDVTKKWWIGGQFTTKFAQASSVTVHPIMDLGELSVALVPAGLRITTDYGDNLLIPVPSFDPAMPFTFIVGGDATMITAWVKVNNQTYTGQMPLTVFLRGNAPILRFGGFQGSSPGVADMDFTLFTVKVDDEINSFTATSFLTDPVPYVITQDDRTDNALLRYHYTFSNSSYRAGFVGGFPNRYEDLSWTPVSRDFVLRKGYLNIPPTKAKYWKFEFCGLVPESYEVYKPIRRTVKTYPFNLWNTALASPTLYDTLNTLFPGILSSMAIGTGSLFSTATTSMGTGGTSNPTKTATMARVLWDSATRASVGGAYWAWNFLPLHQPASVPRFPAAQKHTYEVFEFDHTIKLAYFVGLKDIQAFRLNYLSIEDTEQYVELFNDLSNVASNNGNWTLTQEHMLSSGSAEYAEVSSQILPSSRVVRGVQFATQQSVAKQLLLDDDFNDPTHSNWAPVGDAVLTPGVTTNNVLGTTVKIDRSPQKQSWSEVSTTVGTWAAINTLLFSSIENAVVASRIAGGITSIPVGTPAGGRIYAAARVMAPTDLSAPLQLQIVDDSTGNVLSEDQIDVKANQVTEWFTGFTIGDIVSNRPFLWKDFYGKALGPYLLDKFQRVNANTLTTLDSGQLWSNALDVSNAPLSLHIVSNQATVTTEGQFNYIDSQYPWGTLEIVVGTMGSSAANEIKLVDLDPLYFDDQGVLYFDGGDAGPAMNSVSSIIGRAVQVNDDIRIDIMPTLAVPAGKTDPAADPAMTPYSLVIYLNGTWVKTISHPFGARTVKGIKGRLGQKFVSFSWKPTAYGQVTRGKTIVYQPRIERGTLISLGSGSGGSFLDREGNTWVLNGNWDMSTATESPTYDFDGLPLSASQNGSVAAVDVGYWYGTLRACVRHVAGTAGPTNLITTNPSFESGLTGWVALSLSTIATHAGGSVGSSSASATSTTTSSETGISMDPALKFAVTPGQRYTMSFDVNPQGNTVAPRPAVAWYTAGGASISIDVLTQPTLPVDSNWHSTYATFFAPPTAATAQPIASLGTLPVGQAGLIDNVSFNAVDAGAKHGNVLCIDYDNGIYVRYDGKVVDTSGIVYGTLFPSGIPDNCDVSLHFVRTAQLLSANQGGYNPTQYPDMIIAKINNVIVGRFVGNYLSVWRGTRRGVAGDVYSGLRPAAVQAAYVNSPSYTLDTAFRSVSWGPDASNVASTPSAPTWDNISDRGLATWDNVTTTGSAITRPRLRAQLQQHGQTADTWEIDTLSLFVDPIMWLFSNDGGTTFFPALDIRNNPNGVLSFPVSQVATSLNQKQGNALVWKAVAYAPECTVSSLVIRPWYGSLLSGVTHFVGILNGDPNVMPYDHYPDIRNDARFQTWNSPIPENWWHRFRTLQRATDTSAPRTADTLYPGLDTFPGTDVFPG